jgi:hypothetical protein
MRDELSIEQFVHLVVLEFQLMHLKKIIARHTMFFVVIRLLMSDSLEIASGLNM